MDGRLVALTHAGSFAAEAILEKLPETGLAADSLVLLGDDNVAGTKLGYGDTYLLVQDQREYSFKDCGLVLMPEYDSTIEARLSSLDTILVSHAINSDTEAIFAANRETGIKVSYTQSSIRLPGSELSCLMGVLPGLHRAFDISRCNLVLLRSAESNGKDAAKELAGQTVELLNGREAIPSIYPQQIAFNMLPASQMHNFDNDLLKLIGKSEISCIHQVINVPVFHGVAISVQLEFATEVSLEECRALLDKMNAVDLVDADTSPISHCNQSFSCVINQVEQAEGLPRSISFWMLADPMRYGLANNYVHVTDILLKSFL
ncbi:MAG: Asd/ArgC dimerization domain-containing protein [Gammaproteobacteria bacterium]|nr:Asd/ArgC dimerization domain-containing protein [Gammaproteobacteria bacterium]